MKKKNKRINELDNATFDADTAQNIIRNKNEIIQNHGQNINTLNSIIGNKDITIQGLQIKGKRLERELTEANNKIADMQYAENIIVEFVQKTVGIA